MEPITYRKLRDRLNKLSEDQLDQTAQMWPEEQPVIEICGITIASEDQYYDPENEDDGCMPLSDFDEDMQKEVKLGIKKGTVAIF